MSLTNFIENIHLSSQEKIGNLSVPISIWGNGAADAIQSSYDYFEYEQSFNGIWESEYQPAKIILIVGPINTVQLNEIKDRLKSLEKQKPFVVYAEGLLPKRVLNNAKGVVKDIRNHIRVDLEYQKHPIQLRELISGVFDLMKGRNEK